MAGPALDAHDIRFEYGETRGLDGVTLRIEANERVALLGRNGSGKTTLLSLASTQLAPAAGSLQICGFDTVRQSADVRRQVGVVFQSAALDPALTTREALTLQAALVRIPRSERPARIDVALRDAGLAGRADDRIGTLSGGLARRLDLSRGLLHRPALALLDEPTTGLDPIAREAFWDFLDRRRSDGAQLVSTHLMDEAERCDRVVILHHGRIVADGTPDSLTSALGADALWLDTPTPAALADALGADARVVGDRVLWTGGDAQHRVADVYARPDVLAVALRPPSLADVFEATVGDPPEAP